MTLLRYFVLICWQIMGAGYKIFTHLKITSYRHPHLINTLANITDMSPLFMGKCCHAIVWPKSKFLISNGYDSESMHIWPWIGKAKMRLRSGSFLTNCKQTAENMNKFSKTKRNYCLSNTFWLYQFRVKYASFKSYSHLKSEILIWVTL